MSQVIQTRNYLTQLVDKIFTKIDKDNVEVFEHTFESSGKQINAIDFKILASKKYRQIASTVAVETMQKQMEERGFKLNSVTAHYCKLHGGKLQNVLEFSWMKEVE